MARIELASDGLVDSLTQALAPARFLEILRTELSMAAREGRKITLISARLREIPSSDENTVDHAELILYRFAQDLQKKLRAGDHCGRISEMGFWIMVRGDEEAARKAAPRLINREDEELWRFEFCESEVGESIKNLLRRMDAIHFTK